MTFATAPFDHQPRTRIVFGNDTADRIGKLAQELGGEHTLLVTDPGVSAAGHAARVRSNLERAGLAVSVYDRVRENPTTRDVDDCLAIASGAGINLIIGLGGGSCLDTAKGCNFLLTNGGELADYQGVGKAAKPMLAMIAIPTTAGTGSECQSFAVIVDETTHRKMACGDIKAAPAVAVLDPTLTTTQPHHVAACSGIDVVAHAVETYVTTKRTALSMMYAREAFRLAIAHLPAVLSCGDAENLSARGAMLLGAALAGMAIENSMLGAAHAAANPLTAHFGIAHGQAVGMMLPHIIRFNAQRTEARRAYAKLAADVQLTPRHADDHAAAERLAQRIEALLDAAELPRTLAGFDRSMIATLAEEATGQWTCQFNPRPVTLDNFKAIYEQAFGGR